MNGLYLQGGGAKGAFQAGVIYGLYKKGIKFNILSGTSIGAINGYFIFSGNIEKLKEVWTSIEPTNDKISGKVVENKNVTNMLEGLSGRDDNISSFYVNYIEVTGNQLKEVVVDVAKQDKHEGINSVKYSSLLPYMSNQEKTISEIAKDFEAQKAFEQLKQNIGKGLYNGYKLDGGILNNNLLAPFIKNRVDKLYIISLKNDYKIPDYILDAYNKEDIRVIKPTIEMNPKDILRFEKEFCTYLFNEGVKLICP